ncbi:AT-rich interactive domain-containing protein 3 [Morella rubra]|uniref:AT-rich interactive domain-containing protein 3 n=1 Tax=Morella rubra TaxID=262757 RepID=A0A6A1V180_9ROSI|nr:AT-rich interactive domain-containing protein 3 [Morella rubra]KAB1220879.1 AT-rich interactive domain-containing protein 3 [Morella rubra]
MSDSKEKEKEKENEENGQEDVAGVVALPNHNASQAEEHEPHDSLPHSVPVDETLVSTPSDAPSAPDDNKIIECQSNMNQPTQDSRPSPGPLNDDQDLVKPDTQPTCDVKIEDNDLPPINKSSDHNNNDDNNHTLQTCHPGTADPTAVAKTEPYQIPETKMADSSGTRPMASTVDDEPVTPCGKPSDIKPQIHNGRELDIKVNEKDFSTPVENRNPNSRQSFHLGNDMSEGTESGTEEQQSAFMKELENFFRERSMEFKPPKFYGEGLNCLKLWRAVTRLGGYDKVCCVFPLNILILMRPHSINGAYYHVINAMLSLSYVSDIVPNTPMCQISYAMSARMLTNTQNSAMVTSCKLWRQVGESFKPPKTCTTVSWTFRGFYEKALLDYERHKAHGGELSVPIASHSEPMTIENQASGSGRARRDAAARAMQGWHSQRLLGNGEVSDPIIKDKNSILQKREKQLKNIGLLKRKKPAYIEHTVKAARTKASKPQLRSLLQSDSSVVDIGPPADWVKINVQKTKDCFEVYALVPGLLREEVRVQSDPAGRLVISGEPEHADNPWGVTPFKKVVSLPSRIDPHQTSAVVTLHGQLFVRVPFEQSE